MNHPPIRQKSLILTLSFLFLVPGVSNTPSVFRQSVDENIAKYKELVKKEPESVEAHCGLADALTTKYVETKEKKLSLMAMRSINKTSRLDKKFPLPHLSMARIRIARGETEEAKASLEQALWWDAENAEAKRMLTLLGGGPAEEEHSQREESPVGRDASMEPESTVRPETKGDPVTGIEQEMDEDPSPKPQPEAVSPENKEPSVKAPSEKTTKAGLGGGEGMIVMTSKAIWPVVMLVILVLGIMSLTLVIIIIKKRVS